MNSFIDRIAQWNAMRYKQEYCESLINNLILEEADELVTSELEVDKLDALVDIVYVAIGAMWKLGLTPEQIEEAIQIVCDSNDSKSVAKTYANVKANIDKGPDFRPPEPRLQEIIDAIHTRRMQENGLKSS